MYKTALTTIAVIFSATSLSAGEIADFPDGDFHKIATTYSKAEQEFDVDVIPAEAFAWIKAVYAADFDSPPAQDLKPSRVSQSTQQPVANN